MSADPFGVCLEPECDDTEVPNELPTIKDMAKSLLGTAKDIAKGAMQGEGLLVTEEVYTTRMEFCNGCEFFRKEDKRCTQCGCFMEAKTRFKKTYCPVGKWGAIND
jgi:formamidopyrimidine-DNA glycosylase